MSRWQPVRDARSVGLLLLLILVALAISTPPGPSFFDILPWLLGAVGFIMVVLAVRWSVATSRQPKDAQLTEALAALNPIERWLWQGVVRRNLAKPRTRLSLMIPKYGLRAATQYLVANAWLAPVCLLLPFTLLTDGQFGHVGGIVERIAWGVTIACLTLSFFRLITARRARGQYRRGMASTDQ